MAVVLQAAGRAEEAGRGPHTKAEASADPEAEHRQTELSTCKVLTPSPPLVFEMYFGQFVADPAATNCCHTGGAMQHN